MAQRLSFPDPRARAFRPPETHVSPRMSRVSVIGMYHPVGFRPVGTCSATRGLGADPSRILPYALPGSDPPAGTAKRSVELDESAILRHVLQPGRVAPRRVTLGAPSPRYPSRIEHLPAPLPRATNPRVMVVRTSSGASAHSVVRTTITRGAGRLRRAAASAASDRMPRARSSAPCGIRSPAGWRLRAVSLR